MLAATKSYLDLVRKVPLRPIQTDDDLERAVAAIDILLAKPSLSSDEDDYLDVLSDLVHKYEKATHPLEQVPDADMLKHLMEGRNLSPTALHRRTGIAVSTIAAVLNDKRPLSRQQVTVLSRFFNVSTDAFALPTQKQSKKKPAMTNGRSAPLQKRQPKKKKARREP